MNEQPGQKRIQMKQTDPIRTGMVPTHTCVPMLLLLLTDVGLLLDRGRYGAAGLANVLNWTALTLTDQLSSV